MNDAMLIEKLDHAVGKSRLVRWDQPTKIATPIRLMVQLDRIRRRWPNLWEQSGAEIVATCAGDADTLHVFEHTDPIRLAYAIRLQRLSGEAKDH